MKMVQVESRANKMVSKQPNRALLEPTVCAWWLCGGCANAMLVGVLVAIKAHSSLCISVVVLVTKAPHVSGTRSLQKNLNYPQRLSRLLPICALVPLIQSDGTI
jgi:hypothetical protein